MPGLGFFVRGFEASMRSVVVGLHLARIAVLLLTAALAVELWHGRAGTRLLFLPGMLLWLLSQAFMLRSPVAVVLPLLGVVADLGGILAMLGGLVGDSVEGAIFAVIAFFFSWILTMLFAGELGEFLDRPWLRNAGWALVLFPFAGFLGAGFLGAPDVLELLLFACLLGYTVVLSGYLARVAQAVESFQPTFNPKR